MFILRSVKGLLFELSL